MVCCTAFSQEQGERGMDHAEEAKKLFLAGYNCAQAVFCAYRDVTGLDMDTAARLASSFGAGMGRLREVCGTMSGALMVLGMIRGYADPQDRDAKGAHYALVREYARLFRERNGTILCRELLRDVQVTEGGEPEERTSEYYARRPCPRLAAEAAALLDRLLMNQNDKNGEERS